MEILENNTEREDRIEKSREQIVTERDGRNHQSFYSSQTIPLETDIESPQKERIKVGMIDGQQRGRSEPPKIKSLPHSRRPSKLQPFPERGSQPVIVHIPVARPETAQINYVPLRVQYVPQIPFIEEVKNIPLKTVDNSGHSSARQLVGSLKTSNLLKRTA